MLNLVFLIHEIKKLAIHSKLTYPTQFVVQQNRSLSWQGNKIFILYVAIVSLGIAAIFAYQGLWLILPFAGIGVFALAISLYLCCLRCQDLEVITVTQDNMLIEKGRHEPKQSWQFQRAWTRLEFKPAQHLGDNSQLYVRFKGQQLEIARFLTNKEKKTLADSLTKALENSFQ